MVKPSIDKALVKARSHLKRGETIEAEKLYKAILKAFPKNRKAKQALANIKTLSSPTNQNPPQEIIEQLVSFYNKGQLELVIEKAQEITKNYPETFIVWNILGVAAARTKRFDQAVYAFRRATLIRPEYSEGYYNMGNALKDQGNLEEAASNLFKMLRLLDKKSPKIIYVAPIPKYGIGIAINDRLSRASERTVWREIDTLEISALESVGKRIVLREIWI